MHPENSQLHAIIDLGSNSARVVIFSCQRADSYHLVDEIREIVRLREGMTETGLSEAAMTRGLFTLQLFKRFCDSMNVDSIIATATSAVREAANGKAFVQRVRNEIGLSLRILDGAEEAFYGVLGALNAVAIHDGVVVDIGGGSAQVSQIRNRRFVQGQALTLGALALTERFVRNDPIKKSEIKNIRAEINRQLDGVDWLHEFHGPLVGLGGTIRTLAKIEAARLNFPLQSINGFMLSRRSLDEIVRLLSEASLSQRKQIHGLVRDRADIILPGALVIQSLVEKLGVDELSISESGLREGLFFERFWSDLSFPTTPNLREFSVLNMARFYGYQEAHAAHIRHLACGLFDQLAPLHGYGEWERELLQAAALLHDIGMVIKYNDHHKYSQTLIAANALPGYSSREIALIALLARYHRKGTPSSAEYSSLMEDGDEERLVCLASLLRLAEYLERSRAGIVRDVRTRWDNKRLWLTLVSEATPVVELWDAQRNAADLMELAFGRVVTIN